MRKLNKENNKLKKSSLDNNQPKKDKYLIGIFIFLWPFIYLFHFILPINGQYTAIGNDFILLYYKYKVYLLACLAEFKFPLWSPSEACGFPFYISPFTQVFYPLNLPLVIWYKISGGYNPIDHQFFAIIGISIFALGIYKWLRLINKNIKAVILSAVIISISFKMTEILRFPNAVHTAAWYPWVLYAITKIFKSQSFKESLLGAVVLVFSLICFCTAGYLYYVYYSQFLFIPYFLIFFVKPFRRNLFGIDSIKWRNALCVFAVCAILTAIICGPYILGVKNLLAQTTDRTGRDLDYSTQHEFNFTDTVGSLVYPPAAEAEGWYFFSITALLIILLYLFTNRSQITIKIFFVLWIAVISYISYGRYSYLFMFLWKYMPGFSSLRVWGRLSIILLPIFAWLLSLSFNHFENMIAGSILGESKPFWKENQGIFTLILAYAAILGIQLYLVLNKVYDIYWKEYFQNVASFNLWFLYWGLAAFIFIFFVLLVAHKKFIDLRIQRLIVSLLIIIAICEMWPVGTHMWTYKSETFKKRVNFDVDKINQMSFSYPRIYNTNSILRSNSISLGPAFSAGIMENWYFVRYVNFLKEYSGDLQARDTLLGVIGAQKIFFTESISHNTVRNFLNDASRYRNYGSLLSYTGDKLELKIDVPAAGYLSFIDNWDSGWKVFVDGQEKKIELLFGTFKSVSVEKGRHQITFIYKQGLLYR